MPYREYRAGDCRKRILCEVRRRKACRKSGVLHANLDRDRAALCCVKPQSSRYAIAGKIAKHIVADNNRKD